MEMASRALANLTILFLLLSITSSHSTHKSLAKTSEQAFFDCFSYRFRSSLNLSEFLHSPDTPSYNKYFLDTLQNLRYANTTAKKPSFIITPIIESDVQKAVVCTSNISITIRVRSGGHDYEALSSLSLPSNNTNPYILIDLAYMHENGYIYIDPKNKTAWVSTGTTVGQLYYEIANKSGTLAFPAGICPTVGIGGHFAGGGIGALMRKYGVSADNIEDVAMVGPDGSRLNRSSMGEDHFWAIRGGGGSDFGIIIAYKIKLVDVPPIVTTFFVTKTLEQGATKLLYKWQTVAPRLDDHVFIRILVFPDHKRNTVNVTFQSLFLGKRDELVAIMDKEFPELGIVAGDCKEMSWIMSVFDFAGFNKNESLNILKSRTPISRGSFKAKSDFVKEPISENGWEGIWEFLLKGKDEPVVVILDPWGGKLDEIPENEIAFPHRKGNLYNIQYFMKWFEKDENVTQRHLDWMRTFYELMTPYVSKNPRAAYLNYKDLDLGWDKGEARVWGGKYFLNNFEKLAYVKGKVDPQSKFWNELSIPPLFH